MSIVQKTKLTMSSINFPKKAIQARHSFYNGKKSFINKHYLSIIWMKYSFSKNKTNKSLPSIESNEFFLVITNNSTNFTYMCLRNNDVCWACIQSNYYKELTVKRENQKNEKSNNQKNKILIFKIEEAVRKHNLLICSINAP